MKTVWLEFTKHCWAPAVERTLFGPIFRLGWMGIGVSQYNLTAWGREWHDALKAAIAAKQSRQTTGKGQQS